MARPIARPREQFSALSNGGDGCIWDLPLSDDKALHRTSEFPNEASVRIIIAAVIGLLALVTRPANASSIVGPGRFCGYSPIIDLRDGEKITTLEGGIHGGSFRWEGAFGSLEVHGVGWASRPKGRIVKSSSPNSPARFSQKRVEGLYQIAIWNGKHGAAYFTSPKSFTRPQLDAIDRVELFEEGQSPSNCKLRTTFSLQYFNQAGFGRDFSRYERQAMVVRRQKVDDREG